MIQRRPPSLPPEQQALVDQHTPMTERVCQSFVHARHAAFYADDLRSIAFDALYACAGRYEPACGVPFGAYAWKHIHGSLCDAFRQESRHWKAGRCTWEDAAEGLEDPSDPFNDSDATTIAHIDDMVDDTAVAAVLGLTGEALRTPGEAGAALRDAYGRILAALAEALAELDPRDRQIVELHDRDGLPWREVTARTGVPERTAKRYAASARRRLAKGLRARGILGAPV